MELHWVQELRGMHLSKQLRRGLSQIEKVS